MDLFTPQSVLGAARSLAALLSRKKLVASGSCLQCGECCRSLVLQLDGGYIASEAAFREACRQDPGYRRFEPIGADAFGALLFRCTKLAGNTCSDYQGRMDFCRTYPTTTIYFTGGSLLPGCGYRFVWQ